MRSGQIHRQENITRNGNTADHIFDFKVVTKFSDSSAEPTTSAAPSSSTSTTVEQLLPQLVQQLEQLLPQLVQQLEQLLPQLSTTTGTTSSNAKLQLIIVLTKKVQYKM